MYGDSDLYSGPNGPIMTEDALYRAVWLRDNVFDPLAQDLQMSSLCDYKAFYHCELTIVVDGPWYVVHSDIASETPAPQRSSPPPAEPGIQLRQSHLWFGKLGSLVTVRYPLPGYRM